MYNTGTFVYKGWGKGLLVIAVLLGLLLYIPGYTFPY